MQRDGAFEIVEKDSFAKVKHRLKQVPGVARLHKYLRRFGLDHTVAENFREPGSPTTSCCYEFCKTEIISTDWKLLAKERNQRWRKVSNIAMKFGYRTLRPLSSDYSCPWAIPIYVEDKAIRDRIINEAFSTKINAFVWPVLPEELQVAKSLKKRRSKIVCIELTEGSEEFGNLLENVKGNEISDI